MLSLPCPTLGLQYEAPGTKRPLRPTEAPQTTSDGYLRHSGQEGCSVVRCRSRGLSGSVLLTTTSNRFADVMRENPMSMSWGPAVDAELGYRQQQVRTGFLRATTRRAARSTARTNRRRDARQEQRSAFTVFGRPAHAR